MPQDEIINTKREKSLDAVSSVEFGISFSESRSLLRSVIISDKVLSVPVKRIEKQSINSLKLGKTNYYE